MNIKKIWLGIVGGIIFSFTASLIAGAAFSFESWQYVKEIKDSGNGIFDVSIDNEVFANSSKGLADVRIVDGANQEVPYKLLTTKKDSSRKDYTPKLINNSVVVGKYSTAILDLGERGTVTNVVTIQTSSDNFQRNVAVYGSDNQTDWNVLKSNGYIYDYTDSKAQVKTQNTAVIFSDSVFRFLKIEIADADSKPVLIKSAIASQFEKKSAQEFTVSPNFETVQDIKSKTTSLVADLGQSGIPTSRILLSAGDENFNRAVAVYSSDDKNSANWKSVGCGYIFRYNTPKFVGENNAIAINETIDRYLKIIVFNNDNVPLNFSKVVTFATYRDLIFQAQDGERYRLFYGNPKAQSPQYDLEKYFQYLDLTKLQNVVVGGQTINSGFVPEKEPVKPFSERYASLLSISLIAAGAVLLVMVYKFFKK